MKTKEKLSYNVYEDRFGNVYPMTADETGVNIDNPMKSPIEVLKKYKFIGQNNVFKVYQLKTKYQ